MTKKKQRITNINYRDFLDNGVIKIIDEKDMETLIIPSITCRHSIDEAKALNITAYYTGARPVEYLDLVTEDTAIEGPYLKLQLKGSKNGLPRPILLKRKKPLVKMLEAYIKKLHPGMYLFPDFRSSNKRTILTKKGTIKEYNCTTDNLRYWFKKWYKPLFTDSVSPYYLRHNRFSKMSMKGLNIQQIRIMKGARTDASVIPYLHMSKAEAKNIASKID